jgi:hypothetical protein
VDFPLRVERQTESDGNCLNHACSLAMFGVHDRRLILRRAVRSFLVDDGPGGEGGKDNGSRMISRLRLKWWVPERSGGRSSGRDLRLGGDDTYALSPICGWFRREAT